MKCSNADDSTNNNPYKTFTRVADREADEILVLHSLLSQWCGGVFGTAKNRGIWDTSISVLRGKKEEIVTHDAAFMHFPLFMTVPKVPEQPGTNAGFWRERMQNNQPNKKF